MEIQLKKYLLISSLLCIVLFSIDATARQFQITDFRFGMGEPAFDNWGNFAGGKPIDPSLYGILEEGIYQGSNTSNDLINFTFIGETLKNTVWVYTRDSNLASIRVPAGTITGGPPPSIDLVTLTADMSSWIAQWNNNVFNQGNNSNFGPCVEHPEVALLSSIAKVTDNNDSTYTVRWNSCIAGDPFKGQIGFWKLELDCLDCPDVELGTADILTASQNFGPNTRTATTDGGDVVISSRHAVSPVGFAFTWTSHDPSILDTDGDFEDATFKFDPNTLDPGNYIFSVTYKDRNVTPEQRSNGEMIIRVIPPTMDDMKDENGNGILDKDEAIGLASSQLQSELGNTISNYIIETSSGTLRLGKTAFCAGKAARMTKAEIDENASPSCGPANNTSDDRIKSIGIGGFYDFEITGVNQGETVDVVIPITASIPDHAVYRNYTENKSWATFISEGNDKLASAKATSPGVCPPPTSNEYTPNLTKGDNCVRLSITDGGPNDGDDSANGLIKDPGGVAEINSGTEAELPSGCSLSGKSTLLSNHIEWLLIVTFLVWIGLVARHRKQ